MQVIDFIGRSERIRTSDPCLPKTVLYQAELHSDPCPLPRSDCRVGCRQNGVGLGARVYRQFAGACQARLREILPV